MSALSEVTIDLLLQIARVMDSGFEPESPEPQQALEQMFKHKLSPLFYNYVALEQKNPKQILAVLNEIKLNATPSFDIVARIFNRTMIAQGLQ